MEIRELVYAYIMGCRQIKVSTKEVVMIEILWMSYFVIS